MALFLPCTRFLSCDNFTLSSPFPMQGGIIKKAWGSWCPSALGRWLGIKTPVISSGRPGTILPVTQGKPEAARKVGALPSQKETTGSTIRK